MGGELQVNAHANPKTCPHPTMHSVDPPLLEREPSLPRLRAALQQPTNLPTPLGAQPRQRSGDAVHQGQQVQVSLLPGLVNRQILRPGGGGQPGACERKLCYAVLC